MDLPTSARRRGRRTRNVLAQLFIAIAIVITTAACARVQFGSEFEHDGAATHSVLVVIERADLPVDLASSVETRLTETELQAREDGFRVERIDTDREVGLRISDTRLDGADAGASLNALINSISLDETSGPVAPFQGTFTTESGAVGGAAFQLDMTVDGTELMTLVAALMPAGETLPRGAELADALRLSYVAVMPGKIRESNGQTIRANTVRWDLPYDNRLTMRAESKLGQEGSTAWFVVAAIGGVAAVAAIAGGIGLLLLRRRRRAAAALRGTHGIDEDMFGQLTGPPETMSKAGSTLARAVGRVVSGEQVASVVGQPADDPRDDQAER